LNCDATSSRPKRISSQKTTGTPSIEAGILSTNSDHGQARRAALSAGTARSVSPATSLGDRIARELHQSMVEVDTKIRADTRVLHL
jgi:hypothetical protein